MKAIGKLVLGALMLAGTTVAVAPAAHAQWYGGGYYGGYGYGPGWGRPGVGFSFGVGPSWRRYPRSAYGYYRYPNYLPPPVVDDYYGPPPPRDYGEGYADRNPQRPQYWYFCENPEGYYPYVQDCDNWQQEPAQGAVPPGDYPEYSDPDFRGEQ